MLIPSERTPQGGAHRFSGITLGRPVAEAGIEGLRVLEAWHPPSFRLPRHDHKDASINLVLSGWIREQVGQRAFEYGPGMVLVKPAGADHANQYGPTAVMTLVVQLPTGSGIAESWRKALDEVRLLRSPIGFRHLRQLIAAGDNAPDDSRLALFEAVTDLLAVISQSPAALNHPGTPAWLARVREQLNDSDSREIRLSSIALEAGVDPVTLCRGFTLAFGCAPSAYLRQRRVGRAAAAIAAGPASLSGVAGNRGLRIRRT